MSTREVLRYTRIKPPAVIDVIQRARQSGVLAGIVSSSEPEQKEWARAYAAERGATGGDLAFDYGAYLAIDALPPKRLPARASLKDVGAFEAIQIRDQASYQADRDHLLASVLAFRIIGDSRRAELAGRLLAFVEHVPFVPETAAELDYPAVITKRTVFKRTRPPVISHEKPLHDATKRLELARFANALDRLWTLRNTALRAKTAAIAKDLRTLRRGEARSVEAPTASGLAGSSVRERIARLVEEQEKTSESLSLATLITMNPAMISTTVGAEVPPLLIADLDLGVTFGIELRSFCSAAEAAAKALDEMRGPPVVTIDPACFTETPVLDFDDHIRPLGTADLVRIEERLVTYEPGEISYVENILKGEIRKREVKTTKQFEETIERLVEESREAQRDTSITTKQDLSSQVASELSTRMNSDLSSSASGNGSGTIGVVDFSGSASLGANVSLGVDSRTSTESTSKFAKEIIDKAIERTKSTTMERRTTKTTALYETLNSYEIRNDKENAVTENGIYCFLDKRVCLTEVIYGKRVFLLANLRLPGRNLLCERKHRLSVTAEELGTRPVFDVSVDQIQPSTYKELVTRYKASNVAPPPPPTQTLTRTYKTDSSNENVEKQEMGFGKVAKELAPFFERYRRFVITDNAKLPEGYQVRDVVVTVNHGRNGISVPTHLPLQLTGAAMGAASTMIGALLTGIVGPAIVIPAGLIQLQYAASPLLHLNSDSGNVTICVGNEAADSPYYFFDPRFLMGQLFDAFGNVLASSGSLLDDIKREGETLVQNLSAAAGKLVDGFKDHLKTAINAVIKSVQDTLDSFASGMTLEKLRKAELDFGNIANLEVGDFKDNELVKTLFDPINAFIKAVLDLFRIGINGALEQLFEFMESTARSSQTIEFTHALGMRGELPISLNTIALNPGVTVNVVACLSRTNEALDKWRLQTFELLYQAYLQQLAEWESKAMMRGEVDGLTRNPLSMRDEEAAAIKELVLHAMNNYHAPIGNKYTFERINFFENAIDWQNLTYRVFNYGPNADLLELDQMGAFAGADDRRRAFLRAAWAQVLIPVQDKADLEQKVLNYFRRDELSFDGDLDDDELAALYQELVRDRAAIDPDNKKSLGEVLLPTDLILVQSELPNREPCPPILPP